MFEAFISLVLVLLPYVVFFFFLQHPPFSTSASGGPPIISIVSLFPVPCIVFNRATFDVDAPIAKSVVAGLLRSLFRHDSYSLYRGEISGHSLAHHHPKRVFYYVVSRFDKRRAFPLLSLSLSLFLSLSLYARDTRRVSLAVDRSLSFFLSLATWPRREVALKARGTQGKQNLK